MLDGEAEAVVKKCGWRISLLLIISSLMVDFTSLAMAIAIIPQIGSNCGKLSDFDWISSVGLVGSAVSTVATWGRYAPDGCKMRLPFHLGLLLIMGIFSVPVAVYGYALNNFELLKTRNNCITNPTGMDNILLLIFVLVIINCYKYAAVVAVEFISGDRHVWCLGRHPTAAAHLPTTAYKPNEQPLYDAKDQHPPI